MDDRDATAYRRLKVDDLEDVVDVAHDLDGRVQGEVPRFAGVADADLGHHLHQSRCRSGVELKVGARGKKQSYWSGLSHHPPRVPSPPHPCAQEFTTSLLVSTTIRARHRGMQ